MDQFHIPNSAMYARIPNGELVRRREWGPLDHIIANVPGNNKFISASVLSGENKTRIRVSIFDENMKIFSCSTFTMQPKVKSNLLSKNPWKDRCIIKVHSNQPVNLTVDTFEN